MAIILKEVDAVCIGVGFTGSIMARELTKAGLKVVGLERGAGAHWNGVTWRLLPTDHNLRAHLENRYGKNAIPAEMTIEDFPVSYDELEPYYDRFEKLLGISGKAGNLRGQKIDGGNVFEGPRQNEYPNKPLAISMAGATMEKAARELGYHPFRAPAANMSSAYTNPEGVTLGACEYCGHCERFGCEANAKSSPQSCVLPVLLADDRFELRTHSYVKELVYDRQGKKVKAVRYVDTRSRRASSFSAPTFSTMRS